MLLTNLTDNKVIGVLGDNLMPGASVTIPRDKLIAKADKKDKFGDIMLKPDGTPYQYEQIIPAIKSMEKRGFLRIEGEWNLRDEYEEEKNAPVKNEPVKAEPVKEEPLPFEEEAPVVEEKPAKKTRAKKKSAG